MYFYDWPNAISSYAISGAHKTTFGMRVSATTSGQNESDYYKRNRFFFC